MDGIRTPYNRQGHLPGLPNAAMHVQIEGWAEHWTTSEAIGATLEDDCCHSTLERSGASVEARCPDCGALWYLIERVRASQWEDN